MPVIWRDIQEVDAALDGSKDSFDGILLLYAPEYPSQRGASEGQFGDYHPCPTDFPIIHKKDWLSSFVYKITAETQK